jgi:Tat protein secretion system quality control protein TatD with DNase activity
MFDESEYGQKEQLSQEDKTAHYKKVLKPQPEDYKFLQALPEPLPFSHFIAETRSYLQQYPLALVGEIGLDRGFRVPEAWLKAELAKRDEELTPGSREGRPLSPYRVDMEHQKKVLLAQLRLAGEMQRACSVHGVQAHGILFDTLCLSWKGHERRVLSNREKKMYRSTGELPDDFPEDDEDATTTTVQKPFPPRICLHSFSGPAEAVKQYLAPTIPCEIFFSFSKAVNSWAANDDGKVEAAVKAVPNHQILIESDLDSAGQRMDDYLREVVLKICRLKGWPINAGVQQLRKNWRRFILGDEFPQEYPH